MTKADEILAATLNMLGTPEGDEPAEVRATLKKMHSRSEHSHPLRWVWHVLAGWSRRHRAA